MFGCGKDTSVRFAFYDVLRTKMDAECTALYSIGLNFIKYLENEDCLVLKQKIELFVV